MAFSQYGQGCLLPDLNYSLVSNKTLTQKIKSLVWLAGPDDLGQNVWTYPHYDGTHKKTKCSKTFSNYWKNM